MAKIALRAYHRDIESLIERGQNQEAIAHCKHILKYFPKSIDTYRLLGKAYLESQRYGEAADILQRILSVVPDDFVSQIGTSIIREDEGNLDAAIYHMERAFEVQPSNPAIQEELRRLYGRRDGVVPPRVRLTRGALLRMYARGELYRQAIAEARAAIAEDPKRLDLEVILAQMYYRSGLKVEATETCGRLVSKLPYCLVANQILSEILPGTSRAEDAKIYLQRLQALDPYRAFLSQNALTSDQVPEQAITIDRLDFRPEDRLTQEPEWAQSAGISLVEEKTDASTPDWLGALSEEPEHAASQSILPSEKRETEIPGPENGDIPDWMRDAGWSESSAEVLDSKPRSILEQDENETEESEIAQAEIPDWLTSAAPAENTPPEQPEDENKLEWLGAILPTTPQVEQSPIDQLAQEPVSEIPDWLSDFEDTKGDNPPPSFLTEPQSMVEDETASNELPMESSLPDWLSSSETKIEPEKLPADENLPEWLGGSPEVALPALSDESSTGVTGWLNSLDESTVQSSDSHPPASSELDSVEAFGKESSDAISMDSIEPINALITEDNPAWLETLEEAQSENVEIHEQPDQLNMSVADQEIVPLAVEQPISSQPGIPNHRGESNQETTPEMDADAAFAWLEALAAKQGATEALLLNPEERLENPPDWVAEAVSEAEGEITTQNSLQKNEVLAQPEPTQELITEPSPDSPQELQATTPDELPESLAEISQDLSTDSSLGHIEEPGLLDKTAISQEIITSVPAETVVSASSEKTKGEMIDADAAFAWMEALAARQGASEALILSPEERSETPPEWIAQASQEAEEQILVSELEEVTPPILADQEILEEKGPEIEQTVQDVEQGVIFQEVNAIEAQTAQTSAEQDTKIETIEQVEKSELPEWLQEIGETEESPHPVEEKGEDTWLKEFEPTGIAPAPQESEEPGEMQDSGIETKKHIEPIAQAASPTHPVSQKPKKIRDSKREEEPGEDLEILEEARNALRSGNLGIALEHYNQLIQKGDLLDEIISDLQDALYRYPVDISIWMSIGDAYARNDRLQDALDAYTKAEELLR